MLKGALCHVIQINCLCFLEVKLVLLKKTVPPLLGSPYTSLQKDLHNPAQIIPLSESH